MARSLFRPAVVAVGALVALTLVAGPAAASSHHGAKPTHHVKVVTHKKKAKKPKYVGFALGGKVTAVDADAKTLSVAVRKGRSTTTLTVTMVVAPNARIRRNHAAVSVGDLRTGDWTAVYGTREVATGVRTAKQVKAWGPKTAPVTPAPAPAPVPA